MLTTHLRSTNLLPLVLITSIFSFSSVAAPIVVPDVPIVSAKGFVLLDFHSGDIIASKNPDSPLKPASLTKLMTSYVAGQEIKRGNISQDDQVVISRNAWAKNFPDSSKMFIEAGKSVAMMDLYRGLVIQSGNDASVAIAEHVAGSEGSFVGLMNAWASRLELNNTRFENPHGLDSDNQASTPYDMAKLAKALIQDLPELYPLYSESSFTFNSITQHNRNALLHDRSMNVDGMKTGYTSGAGYSLVSSATDGERRLISVVMGSSTAQSRSAESKQLLNYGFRFFDTIEPHKVNDVVFSAPIWMGNQNTLSLGIQDPVYLTIPSGAGDQIRAEMNISNRLSAPIEQGSVIGDVTYFDGQDQVLKVMELVAIESVEKGNVFKRLLDWVRMLFI